MFGVASQANHVFQDDAIILHVLHLAGLLVDDPVDTIKDAVGASTERNHLSVERHATIPPILVDRFQDFLVTADLD